LWATGRDNQPNQRHNNAANFTKAQSCCCTHTPVSRLKQQAGLTRQPPRVMCTAVHGCPAAGIILWLDLSQPFPISPVCACLLLPNIHMQGQIQQMDVDVVLLADASAA
jgi:hypothetical protein